MLHSLSKRLDALRENRDKQSGFTLIELLIVIVILGILAAVVVFSVQGITDRGNVAACKADISTAETAVEAYYAQKGSYPASLAALVPGFLHSAPADVDYNATTHAVTGKDNSGAAGGNDCSAVTV